MSSTKKSPLPKKSSSRPGRAPGAAYLGSEIAEPSTPAYRDDQDSVGRRLQSRVQERERTFKLHLGIAALLILNPQSSISLGQVHGPFLKLPVKAGIGAPDGLLRFNAETQVARRKDHAVDVRIKELVVCDHLEWDPLSFMAPQADDGRHSLARLRDCFRELGARAIAVIRVDEFKNVVAANGVGRNIEHALDLRADEANHSGLESMQQCERLSDELQKSMRKKMQFLL